MLTLNPDGRLFEGPWTVVSQASPVLALSAHPVQRSTDLAISVLVGPEEYPTEYGSRWIVRCLHVAPGGVEETARWWIPQAPVREWAVSPSRAFVLAAGDEGLLCAPPNGTWSAIVGPESPATGLRLLEWESSVWAAWVGARGGLRWHAVAGEALLEGASFRDDSGDDEDDGLDDDLDNDRDLETEADDEDDETDDDETDDDETDDDETDDEDEA
jgi:hypothetical protein